MWKRLLRLPVHLYRARLGFIMGERILLLTHRGRVSGRVFQTPVEVVEHDQETDEYIICSGTGPHADWYRNITEQPAEQVQVRNRRWRPHQRMLDGREAAQRFARYEKRHPRTARRLLTSMGKGYDGTENGRAAMMASMPMVAFSYSEWL
ncbi:nitroreductase [Actinoplanes campanulatus]|nr:nitroreductase [Actinoplanes campanulatus]GID36689.1 nitroreductase [Actinoplanes campanulatus]